MARLSKDVALDMFYTFMNQKHELILNKDRDPLLPKLEFTLELMKEKVKETFTPDQLFYMYKYICKDYNVNFPADYFRQNPDKLNELITDAFFTRKLTKIKVTNAKVGVS
jgi:hypothetical protein